MSGFWIVSHRCVSLDRGRDLRKPTHDIAEYEIETTATLSVRSTAQMNLPVIDYVSELRKYCENFFVSQAARYEKSG